MTQLGAGQSTIFTIDSAGIYAVGRSLSLDRRISWFPPTMKGYVPSQAYLIKNAEDCLLIDTGLTIHRSEIIKAVQELMAGADRRRLAMTRREADTMINLPYVVKECGIEGIMAGSISSIMQFFDFEDLAANEYLKSEMLPEFQFIKPGGKIDVGELSVEVLSTPLKVLSTHWYFEERSRSLFTSDSWCFVTSPQPVGPFATRASDEILFNRIEQYLLAKFDWLWGSDTAPLIDELRQIFAGRSVQRICPTFGGIIEGEEAVQRTLDITIDVLKHFAFQPYRSRISGFISALEEA